MKTEIKKLNNQKGFTLVELIVVIAILAILAAVAVPNYMNYQRRSRVNTDISSAGEIIRAARIQIIEQDLSDVPKTSTLSEVANLKPISGGTIFKSTGAVTTNGIKVSFVASNAKAGDYNGTYTVTEGAVETAKASIPAVAWKTADLTELTE